MKRPQSVTIRPTVEDWQLLSGLMKRKGLNATSVIREALRLLVRKEKAVA